MSAESRYCEDCGRLHQREHCPYCPDHDPDEIARRVEAVREAKRRKGEATGMTGLSLRELDRVLGWLETTESAASSARGGAR